MKYIWFLFLLAISPFDGLNRIALRNRYAQQAEAAYKKQEYQQAALYYERLRATEDEVAPPSVLLNLAHSYFHLRDYSRASPLYKALLKAPDKNLISSVATQLSVIEAEEGNFDKAIAYSKQAIIADQTNTAARYNYELLQKYLLLHPEKRQGPMPQQRQNKQNGSSGTPKQNASGSASVNGTGSSSGLGAGNNAPGGGQTNSPNGQSQAERQQNIGRTPGQSRGVSSQGTPGNTGMGGNQKSNQAGQTDDPLLQTRYERLKKLQLSPEKARQLLDAMRQEEAQYLQQLPRKKSKQEDKNTPDW